MVPHVVDPLHHRLHAHTHTQLVSITFVDIAQTYVHVFDIISSYHIITPELYYSANAKVLPSVIPEDPEESNGLC